MNTCASNTIINVFKSNNLKTVVEDIHYKKDLVYISIDAEYLTNNEVEALVQSLMHKKKLKEILMPELLHTAKQETLLNSLFQANTSIKHIQIGSHIHLRRCNNNLQ